VHRLLQRVDAQRALGDGDGLVDRVAARQHLGEVRVCAEREPVQPVALRDHPLVEALLIDGYRRMTVAEKMARVTAMSRAIQQLALVDVWRAHPDANERELALRLASRRLDAETMRRAFGWDPEVEGY
jgi:hypothetical protein